MVDKHWKKSEVKRVKMEEQRKLEELRSVKERKRMQAERQANQKKTLEEKRKLEEKRRADENRRMEERRRRQEARRLKQSEQSVSNSKFEGNRIADKSDPAGWLLNWINEILKTEGYPPIDQADDLMTSGNRVLSALNRIIFAEHPTFDEDKKLQKSLQSGKSSAEISEFMWNLLKYYYKITASDEALKEEYEGFITMHPGTSWENGDVIRYITYETLCRSQRKRAVKATISVTKLRRNPEDINIILQSNQLPFDEDRCKHTVLHLALRWQKNADLFVVKWAFWLLGSKEPLSTLEDFVSVKVINELVTMKHEKAGTEYQAQSSLGNIIKHLCEISTFDSGTFDAQKVLKNDPSSLGHFGWALLKWFYDIRSESQVNASLVKFFGVNKEADFSKSIISYAQKISAEQDEVSDDLKSCLRYLFRNKNVPELFDLANIKENVLRIPFRTRTAFFTILRLIQEQK